VQPIRIFLSSPNDVLEEQDAVIALVSEINDVVAFLSPHLDVRVEVVRYQDNTYPDIGRPQDVVDRHIPQDYEIHLGIMWMRCGTPTTSESSGTIHEFRQAAKRREATGSPIIMFYFSEEPPPSMPKNSADLEQMGMVLKFREELQNIGLTVTYPNRKSFRDRVRVGLLRAIADVAKAVERNGKSLNGNPSEPIAKAMQNLSLEYELTREKMRSSYDRTKAMTSIFASMCSEAPMARQHLSTLSESVNAGDRLAAVAILSVFPDRVYLEWLANRLDPETEKPFVGFQAGSALLQAVLSLSPEAEGDLVCW
jgi:hypothetical protein